MADTNLSSLVTDTTVTAGTSVTAGTAVSAGTSVAAGTTVTAGTSLAVGTSATIAGALYCSTSVDPRSFACRVVCNPAASLPLQCAYIRMYDFNSGAYRNCFLNNGTFTAI